MRVASRPVVGTRSTTTRRLSCAVRLGLLSILGTACGATSSRDATEGTAEDGGTTSSGHQAQEPAGMSGGGSDATRGGAAQSAGGESSGEGGIPTVGTVEPTLDDDCRTPGALACAGHHQKLTLVCSSNRTWEENETCLSGQFCDSASGSDLGTCKTPEADCEARQPGDAFCSGADDKDAVKCDADGLATELVEHCAARCVDGKCAPFACPSNVIDSCNPNCVADPGGAVGCYDLCRTVEASGPPLLNLENAEPETDYTIALPVVADGTAACVCGGLAPMVAVMAFRLPMAPVGYAWRLTYPAPWQLSTRANATGEVPSRQVLCQRDSWAGRGCAGFAFAGPMPRGDDVIWLGSSTPVPDPSTAVLTLLPINNDVPDVCAGSL